LEASEYETLTRLSVTILAGILGLVIIILGARWLMIRGTGVKELDSDQLRLEMEAIAEQKKKERLENPEEQEELMDSGESTEDESEFIEGQPL